MSEPIIIHMASGTSLNALCGYVDTVDGWIVAFEKEWITCKECKEKMARKEWQELTIDTGGEG